MLIIRLITFDVTVLDTINVTDGQTDRQTDGQTTVAVAMPRFELCASRNENPTV